MKRMIDQELFDEKLDAAGVETLLASGDVPAVYAGEIIENMTGYSFTTQAGSITYAGCVKTGNKITFVEFGSITTGETLPESGAYQLGYFRFPSAIGQKLIPDANNRIYTGTQGLITTLWATPKNGVLVLNKDSDGQFTVVLATTGLSTSTTYSFRLEFTFLLSDNLVVAP